MSDFSVIPRIWNCMPKWERQEQSIRWCDDGAKVERLRGDIRKFCCKGMYKCCNAT